MTHECPSPGDRLGEEQGVQAGVVEALADVAPRGQEESRLVGRVRRPRKPTAPMRRLMRGTGQG
ncbi:MAG: hypothetical protein DYH06_00405 [Acidobacteria bacterium ACB2]|nr:hypothetical protein [Acidobacteria bacterium ACB2]